jgi:endonuclease/exonuclease/phosphatase family metal-dependent hydrolase
VPAEEYEPPDNDNLTRGFENIIPQKYRGSDMFLDLITWNIRFFHDMDSKRVSRVVQVLSALNADIIVLQEIRNESLLKVADQLAKEGAGYYEVVYGTTGGNQRVSIMHDLDWIRTKDSPKELFIDEDLTTVDGKNAFPILPLRQYFTALSHSHDPFDCQIIGLHLKSQRGGGENQRQLAAERLKTWLIQDAGSADADVIMIGDWNASPDQREWEPIHDLEDKGLAMFREINDKDSISHLMYENKNKIGTRLDMASISMATKPQLKSPPQPVRWKSLDKLLDSNPKAKDIKKYIREISHSLSDHMPVVTRFYFENRQRLRSGGQ